MPCREWAGSGGGPRFLVLEEMIKPVLRIESALPDCRVFSEGGAPSFVISIGPSFDAWID
jgi:hypothetical protein